MQRSILVKLILISFIPTFLFAKDFNRTRIRNYVKDSLTETYRTSRDLLESYLMNDYDLINDLYRDNIRSGRRLPNYPKTPAFVEHCLSQFNYPKEYKVKNLGFIKKIKKDDSIIPRKKPSKGKYDIIAYDLYIDLPYNGIPSRTKFRFYYYRSKLRFSHHSPKNPLILISPSLKGIKANGMRAIETKWARAFALNGINSMIISLDDNGLGLNRPLKMMDQGLIKQVVGLRLILDFVKDQLDAEIDQQKIGALGASLGGIRTAILMGVEPQRVKAGVLVVAGGNFPDLWTTSRQKLVKKYRNHRIQVENIPGRNERAKLKFLYKLVKKTTCTDPLIFTHRRASFADDVSMYIGTTDRKVPTKNQLELWAGIGKPRAVTSSPLKHSRTIYASANSYRDQIVRFFNRSFGF